MRDPLEISKVFNNCEKSYITNLSPDKRRIFSAITSCRTSKLGAHIRYCSSCRYQQQSYNSCRNRHCPKCQGSISANWTEQRNKELLPVEYFHSVFTIPKELRSICYQNKKVFYEIMFRSVSETLRQVAANPKFLGAEIGFITILHTWNQKLDFHPHIHVISPKGGLSIKDNSWISPKANFFLPVRALSKVYRGKLIDYLRQAYQGNKLSYFGSQLIFKERSEFEKLIGKSRKSNWVVYSKKSFGGATQVIKYLSSYVHRIAISNKRLRKIEKNKVSFSYRDSRNQNKKKILTLDTKTFTSRFLLHALPRNFTRIRHYGFLGSAKKATALEQIRNLLLVSITTKQKEVKPLDKRCPNCLEKTLKTVVLQTIPHSGSDFIKKTSNLYTTSPPCSAGLPA